MSDTTICHVRGRESQLGDAMLWAGFSFTCPLRTFILEFTSDMRTLKQPPRYVVIVEALAKVFSCWVWMANKLAAQARL